MAKTKRLYVLATCFLSGTAAIISFVALGTQEWVKSPAIDPQSGQYDGDFINIGLFGGAYEQTTGDKATHELTTVCAFDLNICAVLCGDNMVDNLRRIYNNEDPNEQDKLHCQVSSSSSSQRYRPRATENQDKVFINAGVWLCTIIFLIFSAIMGLFSAGLAVWNTATSPYQVYFSIFGLYIYNAIAFSCILLAIILWGALFARDLSSTIPTYEVLHGDFSTDGQAQLGYSYWINLISLFFYAGSVGLLYLRNYLISNEPKVNVQIEDTADPVIYLY